jgi:hypothetical protein
MIGRLKAGTSPSLVVALAALCLSLSGTALAASHYVITSSRQVKPGAIALRNISASARASLRGQQGPQGPQGAPGQSALANAHVYTRVQTVPPNSFFFFFILCNSGERAIGGGANTTSSRAAISQSYPVDSNGNGVGNGAVAAGWRTEVVNSSGGQLTVTYYSVCA